MKHFAARGLALLSLLAVGCASAPEEEELPPRPTYAAPAEMPYWMQVYAASTSSPASRSSLRSYRSAGMTTRIYDVRDLLHGVAHSSAPYLGDLRPESLRSDDDARGIVERVPLMTEDTLLRIIEDSIAPGTWVAPGAHLSIRNGRLIVRH